MPRTLVIVPAYNETDSLPRVLSDLATHAPWADVVVVDDCSTDRTAEVARLRGAAVLSLPCNLGVGGAMQTGYLYAARRRYEVAVQFDGDGQHRANQIEPLVSALVGERADLVIGSRLLEKVGFRFAFARFVGSRLLAGLIRLLTGVRTTDPTSGFRAASSRAIRFFARHYPQTYLGDTAEALVWAARQKMRIRETPTRMRQRQGGASAATNFKGLLHMLRITLAVLVDCLEPRVKEDDTLAPQEAPAARPDHATKEVDDAATDSGR